jgi:uncharacterized membrane protein YidH (DUF202 family)
MENKKRLFAFQPENYRIMLIGLGINILGFLLMIGGAADSPDKFEESEIFSSIRITLAPMLIIIGYLVIMYSIMRKSKSKKD